MENDCTIVENQRGYLNVQLSIDMDKELMNRPFYWTYLEKTGGTPNPMKITFITDQQRAPENLKGEIIHFGAPRLHQLFATTKKIAAYTRLYEVPISASKQNQVPLHPWLMVNLKISYQCDRKRDVFRSFGLNLINGSLIDQFYENTNRLHLQQQIPDYCFTVSPIIKPESGLNRIENYLTTELNNEDHAWAISARKRWETDLKLLDHFYEDHEEKPETYTIEKKAIQEQYEPVIKVNIINGGLFYLASQ